MFSHDIADYENEIKALKEPSQELMDEWLIYIRSFTKCITITFMNSFNQEIFQCPMARNFYKESIIKNNCKLDYCKHTGVGSTINTGFHTSVFKGGDGGGGNILVIHYNRNGYMMRQL